MNRTIYLLRHGQTVFNTERRMQGHCDSPLTRHGEDQVRAMGSKLKTLLENPAEWAIYASPLPRTQASARLVCQQLGIDFATVQTDPRLIEMHMGAWEKLVADDIKAANPDLHQRADWFTAAPRAETETGIYQRAMNFIADKAIPEKCIVVSHGLFGCMFRAAYAALPASAGWPMERPQDAFFRLAEGRIERIAC